VQNSVYKAIFETTNPEGKTGITSDGKISTTVLDWVIFDMALNGL